MYPCHATSLMADNTLYSADFPRAARRFLESVYCNRTLAVYLPRCSGDLRPNLVAPDGTFRSATGHELTVFGRLLGAAVIQAAESAVPSSSGALTSATRSVSLPFDHVPDEQELLAVAVHSTHGVWARELLERLKKHGVLPTYADAEIQIMRLGRHWVIATSGETMIGIGRAIEQGFTDPGLATPGQGDHTMVLGYTNSNAGYFCTSSSFFEGGYEPGTSFNYYLHPGPFSPKIETTLANTALELALELGLPPQLE